jgi:hypothetical protein
MPRRALAARRRLFESLWHNLCRPDKEISAFIGVPVYFLVLSIVISHILVVD